MKLNHELDRNAKTLGEGLGMTEKEFNTFENKSKVYTSQVLTVIAMTDIAPKQTDIAQELLDSFTDKEILFLATNFMAVNIKKNIESNAELLGLKSEEKEDPIERLFELLSKL